MKRIALLMALLALALSLASCDLLAPEKTYTCEEMSITVKGMFSQQNDLHEAFDLILLSPSAGVMVLREDLADFEANDLDTDITVAEYAAILMENNELDGSPVEEDGLTYFTYSETAEGTEFTYIGFCYSSPEAYWLVQCYSTSEKFEDMKPAFITWAKSVTFS